MRPSSRFPGARATAEHAWRWALLPALALFPLATAAQSSRMPSSPPFRIEGTVRDAGTGEPLPGATVTLEAASATRRTTTDDGGRYGLDAPAAGPFRMSVERIGYGAVDVHLGELEPGLPVDFVLERRPVALTPLSVLGRSRSSPLAVVLGEVDPGGPPGTGGVAAEGRAAAGGVEAQRTAGVRAALLATAGGGRGGGGGSPPPPGGEGGGLAVRGPLTRRGTAWVAGAPAHLAGPASFLAGPFARAGTRVRAWDAGAPARITGGLEEVTEVTREPGGPAPRGGWEAGLDLLGSSLGLSWWGERVLAGASGRSTLPWAAPVVGEEGHTSRSAGALLIAAPGAVPGSAPGRGHRVRAEVSVRDETLPLDDSLPPDAGPGLRAELREVAGSVRWRSELAGGALTARAGAARSSTSLPAPAVTLVEAPLLLREHRSHLSAEYARGLGDRSALALGVDRLAHRWSGASAAAAAAWGLYGDLVHAPGSGRWSVRLGGRADRPPAGGRWRWAPRLHVEGRLGAGVHAALGSGAHHQVLLEASGDHAGAGVRPVLARGLHHRGSVGFGAGPVDLRLDSWLKRLSGLPGADGRVDVQGLALGLGAALPGPGRLDLEAAVERRTEGGRSPWSREIAARIEQELPAAVQLRARLVASRSTGGLLLGATPADSAGGGGGAPAVVASELQPWSVALDGQLSRVIARLPGGASLRLHLQLLNALGTERRLLFAAGADPADVRLPRVLVLGISTGGAWSAPAGAEPAAGPPPPPGQPSGRHER